MGYLNIPGGAGFFSSNSSSKDIEGVPWFRSYVVFGNPRCFTKTGSLDFPSPTRSHGTGM